MSQIKLTDRQTDLRGRVWVCLIILRGIMLLPLLSRPDMQACRDMFQDSVVGPLGRPALGPVLQDPLPSPSLPPHLEHDVLDEHFMKVLS